MFPVWKNWYLRPDYYTCLWEKLGSLQWIMWPSVALDNWDGHPCSHWLGGFVKPNPLVACLDFLALLSNGTTQFSCIQIVRKVTWISNSVARFIDMPKVVSTFASLIILPVGWQSLLFGMAKVIFTWPVPHRALFALCVLTFRPSWNYKMLQLCWTSWLQSLGFPSPRTHIGPAFCPAGRDFSMACSTHSLKLENQT